MSIKGSCGFLKTIVFRVVSLSLHSYENTGKHYPYQATVKHRKTRTVYLIIWMYHYSDVIMDTIASQITSVSIVYLTVSTGADQRKHQSSASLAPVNSPHKWPVTHKNVSVWWRHHDFIKRLLLITKIRRTMVSFHAARYIMKYWCDCNLAARERS